MKDNQTLDWVSADIILSWHAPKHIHKPDDIYLKLWGLIQTINTTSTELRGRIGNHQGTQTLAKPPLSPRLLTPKKNTIPMMTFR